MQKELLKNQMITTIFFILSLFISLSLTYDDLLKLDGNKLYKTETARIISISNRILVVILSLSYLYINFQSKKINNNKFSNLQIDASILALIGSIITLYVVIKNNEYTITNIENPAL